MIWYAYCQHVPWIYTHTMDICMNIGMPIYFGEMKGEMSFALSDI